jgi:hypothetical protein
LEDLDAEVEIISAWEMIRENIKISAKENLGHFESKKYMPWFNERCSKLVYRTKQDKLLLLQGPSEINGDNLNNVIHEASRHFRNKKMQSMKDKINDLATNIRNKYIRDLYRGMNEFKRWYQPSSKLVKDENGDLLAIPTIFSIGGRTYFSEILNVHNVGDVRQIEVLF